MATPDPTGQQVCITDHAAATMSCRKCASLRSPRSKYLHSNDIVDGLRGSLKTFFPASARRSDVDGGSGSLTSMGSSRVATSMIELVRVVAPY